MQPTTNNSTMTPTRVNNETQKKQRKCFKYKCFLFVSIKGTARTLVPTNKNCALEPPLFGVVVRVSPPGVQWMGLAVETPPSWSRSVSEPGKYALVMQTMCNIPSPVFLLTSRACRIKSWRHGLVRCFTSNAAYCSDCVYVSEHQYNKLKEELDFKFELFISANRCMAVILLTKQVYLRRKYAGCRWLTRHARMAEDGSSEQVSTSKICFLFSTSLK